MIKHRCGIHSNESVENHVILELHNITYQVESNDIEKGEIRSQSLEAIIDMESVYEYQ